MAPPDVPVCKQFSLARYRKNSPPFLLVLSTFPKELFRTSERRAFPHCLRWAASYAEVHEHQNLPVELTPFDQHRDSARGTAQDVCLHQGVLTPATLSQSLPTNKNTLSVFSERWYLVADSSFVPLYRLTTACFTRLRGAEREGRNTVTSRAMAISTHADRDILRM